jgi:2-dehydropantoate 2-reductase
VSKKILFVGAGAIGSYLGAFLSRAGHAVTIVDPWAEQVDTINRQGISVTGPHDPFTAKPRAVHLHEAQRMPRDFDVAFVAMKVYDTEWATQLAVRHLSREGFVVSSQNCWPDPRVAAVAGQERSLGLIMSKIGVACWRPGEVERGMERGGNKGHDVFRVGEHDGRITSRTQEVADMLKVVDGSLVTDNLWGERWSKLSANSMGNPV